MESFSTFWPKNKAPAKLAQAPTEPFQPLLNLRIVFQVFSACIRNGSHWSYSFSPDPSARHPSAEIRGSPVEWDGEETTEEEDKRWWRSLVVRRLVREEGWREEMMEKKMKGDNVRRKKMNRRRKRKREKRKKGGMSRGVPRQQMWVTMSSTSSSADVSVWSNLETG